MKKEPNPSLRVTHGKNGVAELPTVNGHHVRFAPLVVMFVEHVGAHVMTKAAIVCRVSDADLRDN